MVASLSSLYLNGYEKEWIGGLFWKVWWSLLLLWGHARAQSSSLVQNWDSNNNVLPNNDEWTVYGYLNTMNPRIIHIFGGIKYPTQHYSFDLKTMAVNHYRNAPVAMHCHVQPTSLGDRTYFMNDRDSTFYSIDLVTYAVDQLTTQPSRAVPRVCTTQNGTHIFMLGGMDQGTQTGINNVQVFNLNTKQWLSVPVPRMLTARYDFSCGVDPNMNRLYAIGGQVSASGFTAQIEFISLSDIATAKWKKFKYSLNTPMALYNNAMVPTIIAQANNRRRTLNVHEVTSSGIRTRLIAQTRDNGQPRRLQTRTQNDTCHNAIDTILVMDVDCEPLQYEQRCEKLKNHWLTLVSRYDVSSQTRFGIITYTRDGYDICLPLSQGTNAAVVNEAIRGISCDYPVTYGEPSLQSGINAALQMFAETSRNVAKSLIVYPVCQASLSCDGIRTSEIESTTVSIYVSGTLTQSQDYGCLVNRSRSYYSEYILSEYFFDNREYSELEYREDVETLKRTHCPSIPPKKFNFVQFVTAGGYACECCAPGPCHCFASNIVNSIDVTENSRDLQDPCIADRYYRDSDRECGVVDTTASLPFGRIGARLIYYDCDENGPTLWVFGGRVSGTYDDEEESRSILTSNPIKDAYDTCPVPPTPAPVIPCAPNSVSGSSSSSSSGPWWESLDSSSSSDDNSHSHYAKRHWHWR